MSDHPTPPRRLYTEKEVGDILARATELHGEHPAGSSGGSDGLSLAELEEIGLEAGIDPRDLRRAAMELDSGDSRVSGWARITGDQLTLVREAVISVRSPKLVSRGSSRWLGKPLASSDSPVCWVAR